MTFDQTAIFVILALALAGFIWGRWRYDVVAFAALIAAVLVGVVPSGEAFLGFGHPATITVIGVLIMSRALLNSGAVDLLADRLTPGTRTPATHIGTLIGIGAPLSAIMNNVGALSLLMPVAVQSAIKAKRSPAVILMPLSFGTILGGLVTLIGTPPNIIVATYRGRVADAPFGMFDFTPAGAAVAVAGGLFVALIGWRLIPKSRRAAPPPGELFHIEDYVAEAKVPAESPSIGKSLGEIDDDAREQDVVVIGLIRDRMRIFAAARHQHIQEGDIVVLEAAAKRIDKFVTESGLELVGTEEEATAFLKAEHMTVGEVVVSPGARIEGRNARDLRLAGRYGVNLLAISRQGQPITARLNSVRFRAGDVLLFQGEPERLNQVNSALGLLPLAERSLQIGRAPQAGLTVAIFAAAILAATFGVMSLQIALGLSSIAVVVLRIVPLTQLYEAIDWPVVVLLGAMMPIGEALETTGATQMMVGAIGGLSEGVSPLLILALLLIVTMTLSDVMNNAATAVVAAPIAFGVAQLLGLNPDAFLMAVAIGASCAFLTPIGHQNNALILGPGGYHFGDYWRMGLPLEVLIVVVAVPMIAWVFPL
ncbi:MAG TPA: SLC13 family permease [Alphaproteobacteria bacterium]|nr:SLC13 family permease [Alphaproteobacteria bacterium]